MEGIEKSQDIPAQERDLSCPICGSFEISESKKGKKYARKLGKILFAIIMETLPEFKKPKNLEYKCMRCEHIWKA